MTMTEVDGMSVIARRDERSWRLSGDPVRVDIGPPIFPGCAVDAVPVNELRRVEQQLRGAVDEHRAFVQALTDALSEHGVPAMPSWREAIDYLARHGGSRTTNAPPEKPGRGAMST